MMDYSASRGEGDLGQEEEELNALHTSECERLFSPTISSRARFTHRQSGRVVVGSCISAIMDLNLRCYRKPISLMSLKLIVIEKMIFGVSLHRRRTNIPSRRGVTALRKLVFSHHPDGRLETLD
nr:hypothetical protein CFP56_30979 [Quercus suber]